MLFLWSREPSVSALAATTRVGPWFAWLATAVLLWPYRRRISKAIFGPGSIRRQLKRKRGLLVSKAPQNRHHKKSLVVKSPSVDARKAQRVFRDNVNLKEKYSSKGSTSYRNLHCQKSNTSKRKGRFKQLQQEPDDGPYLTSTSSRKSADSSSIDIKQHPYYKLTRSGRVYGQ